MSTSISLIKGGLNVSLRASYQNQSAETEILGFPLGNIVYGLRSPHTDQRTSEEVNMSIALEQEMFAQ